MQSASIPATISYFSVGEYCETAYQIRRFTGNKSAYFFDWLISVPGSLYFIQQGDEDFLLADNWEICDRDLRVHDFASGLKFQHEFPTRHFRDGEDPIIDEAQVAAHLATARAKFIYLKRKTIDAIQRASACVLIRTENTITSAVQARIRIRQLQDLFMPVNPQVKVVIASRFATEELLADNHALIKIGPQAPWSGDDASWDRLFGQVNHHFWPQWHAALPAGFVQACG